MGQVQPRRKPAGRGDGFHGGAVAGHDDEGDDLAGRSVNAVLDEQAAQQRCSAEIRSVAPWVVVTGRARATFVAYSTTAQGSVPPNGGDLR